MANEKRLISASATVEAFTQWLTSRYDGRMPSDVVAEIPTVDAVEVVHGRWEKFGYDFCCSACGVYQCGHYTGMSNYCPNCGARMDGDGNG